ncbi:MAG: hypothetical protein RL346_1748 [Verrucomicrobiota bacterium]|jgi:16S rRNA pseudouridine516 synthase
MTLTQFIAKHSRLGKRHAKDLLESGQVSLNHQPVTDGNLPIGTFDHLAAKGEILQARTARYVLLHKPIGILSATSDPVHRTVIDLIDEAWAGELHLAGRLDRSTSGLVILTNDSRFSKALTSPDNRIPKTYRVHTDQPIPETVLRQFRKGMSFRKENTRSAPAVVDLLTEKSCLLTIHEGLHHQIKRMFLRFGIRVTNLHRLSIGSHQLGDLQPGEWRNIDP